MDYEGAVEAPIVEDTLSSRFAFRLTQRDGVLKNRCGHAPPPSERMVLNFNQPGFTNPTTLAPFSICGETVGPATPAVPAVSLLPERLKKWVNDSDNWLRAAR